MNCYLLIQIFICLSNFWSVDRFRERDFYSSVIQFVKIHSLHFTVEKSLHVRYGTFCKSAYIGWKHHKFFRLSKIMNVFFHWKHITCFGIHCAFFSKWFTKDNSAFFNPNQTGGGPNGPPGFKSLISREPKVGLTSNQAVNLSLSFVERPM